MLKVDFYNLPTTEMEDCLLFSCKLVNKAWQQINNICILCQNSEQRQQLDQMLWQFKPDSFIPHDLQEKNPTSPVVLYLIDQDYQKTNASLLVNLSFKTPKYYQQFDRIAEFVIDDPLLKERARINYRLYQTANCYIQYHNLTKV